MSSKNEFAQAKQKFQKVTGLRPRVLEDLVYLSKEEFITVVRKLRSPRLTIHGGVRKKVPGRDSNQLSASNKDVDRCYRLLIQRRRAMTRMEIQKFFAWTKRKAGRVLTSLTKLGAVIKEGQGTKQTYKALKD